MIDGIRPYRRVTDDEAHRGHALDEAYRISLCVEY